MTRPALRLASVAGILMLAGCGGGGGGTSAAVTVTSVSAVVATPTPTPTPPPGAVTAVAALPSGAPSSANGRYTSAKALVARVGPTLPSERCLNYAGQLEVSEDADWMRPVVDADFADMVRQGFRTLRLPVNFDRYTAKTAPYAIDATFLARVRHVVDQATAAGLTVIIDNHDARAAIADPQEQSARFVAMWRQIARAYAGDPASVWFEPMNEPKPPLYNAELVAFLKPVIAAIRETNPTRPIVVGGEWSSGPKSLTTLDLPDDPNLAPTVHYYDPIAFTHQGAPFVTPALPTGVTWGSAADYAVLDATVAIMKAYVARTGRVPFIGEYGVYEGVPTAQRAAYYDDVTHAFAQAGLQACVWGYVNNFPIRDANGWIQQILDAIASTIG